MLFRVGVTHSFASGSPGLKTVAGGRRRLFGDKPVTPPVSPSGLFGDEATPTLFPFRPWFRFRSRPLFEATPTPTLFPFRP
eukprot:191507-Prorocentrum_minimum.AAC.1